MAERAGVGIGTLYRHFPTCDAVVEAVYRHEVERLSDAAPALLKRMPATDAGGQPLALDVPTAAAKEEQREEFAWLSPHEAGDRLRWAERHADDS